MAKTMDKPDSLSSLHVEPEQYTQEPPQAVQTAGCATAVSSRSWADVVASRTLLASHIKQSQPTPRLTKLDSS